MFTKYDMAVTMARCFQLPTDHIVPDTTPAGANRPYDARLDCTRVEQLGIVKRTPFDQGIKSVLQPFVK